MEKQVGEGAKKILKDVGGREKMTTFIYFENLSKCLGDSVIKPWEPIPEKRMFTIIFLDYLF